MISLLPSTKQTILDPSIGTGIFPNKILKNSSKSIDNKIFGYDIDPLILNITFSKLKLAHPNFKNLILKNNNFLQDNRKNKFDSIICNPPYLNFHDFDNEQFTDLIEKKFGIKISKLTNIYSLFFINALHYLKQDGRMIFITPSEFFYTGYGETLKKFFLENFTIIGFIIFRAVKKSAGKSGSNYDANEGIVYAQTLNAMHDDNYNDSTDYGDFDGGD